MKHKIYFLISVLLLYVLDTALTYSALRAGAVEANAIFNKTGIIGTIVAKTLFFIMAYFVILKLEKMNRECETGIIVGAMIAVGITTLFVNIGFFIK